ncbi:MAG: enoyl-CoA hydratase-related protein [Thermodesulfobacteriota bacterium]|nr:enoyl-CoA hydratase-related protein [Thermodesulfobacteriota bacterium]
MSTDFIYEVKNHVAYMTINRPERRNALSTGVVHAFLEYLDKTGADKEVRPICITGAGEKAFCAGADLGAAASAQGEEKLKSIREYAELLKKMSQIGKPILARVAGDCMAGGLGLMLSCDIVIAKSNVRFATPEINVGLWPMMIGALLFRHLPRKQAWYLAYSGKRITAEEGKELGMVTKVVEEDRFENEVEETLAMLCSRSPAAMRIGRQAYYAAMDKDFGEALDYLSEKFGEVASTEDATEGLKAFLEKREPVWKGR